jgi:dihydrofolate reductase
MRKLILKMSMSIDGFVCGPKGEGDWMIRASTEDSREWVLSSIWRAGVYIVGKKTFGEMVSYWPTSTHAFAAPMNKIPKVVFSKTGTIDPATFERAAKATPEALATWKSARVASGSLADEIARLKQEPGDPIMAFGGASFAQSLAREGLVDEYQLVVAPVALGRGQSLFSTLAEPRDLELVEAKPFKGGVVGLVYAKKR